MKSVFLALALFFVLLLARKTFVMQAEGTQASAAETRSINPEARSRRIAALESQDQMLALRQQAVEGELERSTESADRVRGRLERASASPDETDAPGNEAASLASEQLQLQQRRRETRLDLERILADRRRVQEEWSQLTGLHTGR